MKKKIIYGIIFAILGFGALTFNYWLGYFVKADLLTEVSTNLLERTFLAVIVGVVLIILSAIMFVLAANSSNK